MCVLHYIDLVNITTSSLQNLRVEGRQTAQDSSYCRLNSNTSGEPEHRGNRATMFASLSVPRQRHG